ncbi:MAG: SDR family oxidoreductase [Bifidobacteriaceae bacterium]|jgi:all-trans-retinol dehydrogenase (NAD+)|nr:SDR family oxidoreductase [Bifidobacteriaceae bacterium]
MRQQGIPLAGARLLITGGGSGIGRLMALGAARKGAAVTVWDRDAARADAVRDQILQLGAQAASYGVDVTDREAVNRAAAAAGPVDVLINCAGVVGGRYLVDEPPESIDRTIDVNLKGPMWVTKAILPGMLERRHGFVATVASAAGILAGSKMTDYAASKAGAIRFNESLRSEMRELNTGIGTMAVCPFFIDTGMFEGVTTKVPFLLPILKPSQVAARVLRGIEHGDKRIIMPPFVRIVPLLRLLPVGVCDWVADLFGINQSMGHFKGRQGDTV